MHHFQYRSGVLHAEDVSLARIAAEVGTPVYVYSSATIERHYKAFEKAFAGQKAHVFYAMKANSNLAVLKTLGALGAGADTVSEGEIRKAMAAGIGASKIVFSGVGKSDAELAFAVLQFAGTHLQGLCFPVHFNLKSAVVLGDAANPPLIAAQQRRHCQQQRHQPERGCFPPGRQHR